MDRRRSEILRMLGYRGQILPPDFECRIESAWADIEQAANPLHTYQVFPLRFEQDGVYAEGTALILTGNAIQRYLSGCRSVALLACTLGAGVDRLIASAEATDINRALLLDVCASQMAEETIEAACRVMENALPAHQKSLRNRFSPGYGDLSLDIHPRFLRVLDTERRIGLTETANHSLLPRKSITALCGILSTE